MSGYFETPLGPDNPHLFGEIKSVVVREKGEKAVLPYHVIRIDSDWTVHVEWAFKGHLSKLICGTWCINVLLESIGPGPELRLPDPAHRVKLDPCGDGHYELWCHIPAGTVPADACGSPYKCVVSITFEDYCERPGPIAGFVETPLLQFYDPD